MIHMKYQALFSENSRMLLLLLLFDICFEKKQQKNKNKQTKTKNNKKTRKAIVLNKKWQLCPGSFRQHSSIDVFMF